MKKLYILQSKDTQTSDLQLPILFLRKTRLSWDIADEAKKLWTPPQCIWTDDITKTKSWETESAAKRFARDNGITYNTLVIDQRFVLLPLRIDELVRRYVMLKHEAYTNKYLVENIQKSSTSTISNTMLELKRSFLKNKLKTSWQNISISVLLHNDDTSTNDFIMKGEHKNTSNCYCFNCIKEFLITVCDALQEVGIVEENLKATKLKLKNTITSENVDNVLRESVNIDMLQQSERFAINYANYACNYKWIF